MKTEIRNDMQLSLWDNLPTEEKPIGEIRDRMTHRTNKEPIPNCCVCGTTKQPISANGYGHLFCHPCGEEHDRKVLARWQNFLTRLAEFDALVEAVGGQAARCPGSIGNGIRY
jgi:hypothetical protein